MLSKSEIIKNINQAEQYLFYLKDYLETNNMIKESKYFAGVGHRVKGLSDKQYGYLNDNQLNQLEKETQNISFTLVSNGYCLRSGGADGMDTFFEKGAKLVNENLNKERTDIFYPKDLNVYLKSKDNEMINYIILL